jgi:hypothetical protein
MLCPWFAHTHSYWIAKLTWIWVLGSSSPGAIPSPPKLRSDATGFCIPPMTSLTDTPPYAEYPYEIPRSGNDVNHPLPYT